MPTKAEIEEELHHQREENVQLQAQVKAAQADATAAQQRVEALEAQHQQGAAQAAALGDEPQRQHEENEQPMDRQIATLKNCFTLNMCHDVMYVVGVDETHDKTPEDFLKKIEALLGESL